MASSIKGPGAVQSYNGAGLRIAIVHARWNDRLIDSLIAGAKGQLLEAGVKEEDIVLESVPGSYELPLAAQRIIHKTQDSENNTAFDAVIAIGALIKGETMHFEYISAAVSHGLMRVQLDAHVPVIFGLLTLLTEQQGLERAGLAGERGHNHGEDWGRAAVELGVKNREDWVAGGCRSEIG
ncbi:lumazine synthase RIB4 [Aspergillus brunneoviolaceus CBS 621.78]|uniref:6,7-dimethyl-8-ribityllumazine synthase n=1 Tax=Aspergillus brunneoviolaceus CBS 621.78 TaxID=1450534 RepID=A0ACD1FU04_9EURO|nr:6,7-dimethyl-8-ribityllumazine synthase [Aspergillus brunneoviolaceus CBS 621.78]RAH40449.1 6,7-dimethyl-8-ribityllumazine synthase [Aspergillus brunneoviolaceus CBS 621.78]